MDARSFLVIATVGVVSSLSVAGALVACTVVSGTSELSGGQCRKCVDASAADVAVDGDAALTRVACGITSCDTRSSWCCLASSGASSCADPCPTATAALGCRLPKDCATGQSCCAFRSTFGGQSEVRFFTDCLAACNPSSDEIVCDPNRSAPCNDGRPCVPSEVASVFVCR